MSFQWPVQKRSSFRLPDVTQRLTINGRTGSGKTQAAAWILAQMPFNRQPYVIVDYKHEGLFADIARLKELSLHDIPAAPGLYVIRPLPHQVAEVEHWLWRVWSHGDIGLYIDEGYLLPDREAFRAILTTGRARHIPVITVSQRPVYMPRYVFSEADFYMAFALNDRRDIKTIAQFTPEDEVWNFNRRLPNYYSRWYDIGRDMSYIVRPVPEAREIVRAIDARLKPRQRWI